MRNHGGGFINQTAYINIGTAERRGRDGDTANAAARKYNDHKHPAAICATADDLHAWANELQLSSGGGYLEDDAGAVARSAGDTALLNGRLYTTDGEHGIIPLGGLGGRVVQIGNGYAVQPDTLVSTARISPEQSFALSLDPQPIGRVVVSSDDTDIYAATRRTSLRAVGTFVYTAGQVDQLAQVCNFGSDRWVAPFVVLEATAQQLSEAGFTTGGSALALSTAITALSGDINSNIRNVRGFVSDVLQHIDTEITNLLPYGVVTISARAPTLSEIVAASGLTLNITLERDNLWRQVVSDCTLQVSGLEVSTRLSFGG